MQKKISALLHENIAPALGCTEPVAVALAATKMREILGALPSKITLNLSKNIIKNAMGVGIPGTDMIGLPIAIALGVVAGDSQRGLEVLVGTSSELEKAKTWLQHNSIEINLEQTTEKLYIECIGEEGENTASVIISGTHANIIYISRNKTILLQNTQQPNCDDDISPHLSSVEGLSFRAIYDFATLTPLEEIRWIKQTAETNIRVSKEGLNKKYGLQVGRTLCFSGEQSLRRKVIGRTCAAIDARMDGVEIAVFSNSGSGNQGLTCTLPVYTFALEKKIDNEELLIRALTLSHLTSIYIKQYIGRLSALCGIVTASIGASCGILLLEGGNYEQMGYLIRNMINGITGMLCDGAKPSCSLKVSVGIHAAFDSIELALQNIVVDETDGLAEKDVDRSILNLAKIGRKGMNETDNIILDIMTNKQS